MPTKKKRVGFIPREDVMRIIDKLSIENNLSNSKIISILVEEALSIRGIFNKNNGKATPSFQLPEAHLQNLSDNSADFINRSENSFDTKLVNNLNMQISYIYKLNLTHSVSLSNTLLSIIFIHHFLKF